MKLILIEDVQGLGYKDDVVEVKSGYGRNYLIPQLKAVIASPSALKVLAENQRQRAHKLAQIKADAAALAAQGIEIDRKNIVVAPVKEVGEYTAKINLHKEVSVELPFEVVAE